MSPQDITVRALLLLSAALIAGKLLRISVPAFRKYFVPSSILGGVAALLVGPELWGRLDTGRPFGLMGEEVYQAVRFLPAILINVVFAALFLGKDIPGPREVWRRAGPQVAFGQTIAWGQYVVGIGITMLLLVPLYDVPPAFGTLIEIGFEGGHGTAAGLAGVYDSIGWDEGMDLALGVATVGVVMGVLLGMILVNWGVRTGRTAVLGPDGKPRDAVNPATVDMDSDAFADVAAQSAAPEDERFSVQSIEPLALHLAYIGVAIGIGYGLQKALVLSEHYTWVAWGMAPLLEHIPLFPLAMIGGILLQQVHDRVLPGLRLSRPMFIRLQGLSLDFLILSAMATLSLSALAANWQPLLILIVVGIAWIVGAFLFLGPRMLPDYWFERGMGDFGQSLGMTATGLLLMRIVDPDYRSPAYEAFGYKQLLFEPFVGGGLFTAMSIPLVVNYGPWTVFGFSFVIMAFWIGFGLLFFSPKRYAPYSGGD